MNEKIENIVEDMIDLTISPSRRGIVKNCVLGNAEYKGTVRVDSTAIPLFRNLHSRMLFFLKTLCKTEIRRLELNKKGVKELYPEVDINIPSEELAIAVQKKDAFNLAIQEQINHWKQQYELIGRDDGKDLDHEDRLLRDL